MLIGGLQKLSLIDYPKKISAVIFTQGCPFRCLFCHNPHLVEPQHFQKPLSEEEIMTFLKKREGKLDGIVISGGEPTQQGDQLVSFIRNIKKNYNLLIKLDTSGINPDILEKLLQQSLLDYVAMDIKAPLDKYHQVIGKKIDLSKIEESIFLLFSSPIIFEFRTTVVPRLHTKDDMIEIGKLIEGAPLYSLQNFVSRTTLDPSLRGEAAFSEEEMKKFKSCLEKYVKKCRLL